MWNLDAPWKTDKTVVSELIFDTKNLSKSPIKVRMCVDVHKLISRTHTNFGPLGVLFYIVFCFTIPTLLELSEPKMQLMTKKKVDFFFFGEAF